MNQEIADIFGTFHDGGIESWEGDLKSLRLKIDCTYLAELIEPEFQYFYILLSALNIFEFHPWEGAVKTEIDDALSPELEIGYANIEDGIVKVSCNQHDEVGIGGMLWIKAASISVQNEIGDQIDPSELYALSDKFWEQWRKDGEVQN